MVLILSYFRSLHPVKFYRDYLNQNIRPDGRLLSKFRSITVNVGAVVTADGSALVRIGNTTVICGIKSVRIVYHIDKSFSIYIVF